MNDISLKQVHYSGITIQIPEIWETETEEFIEEDGSKSYSLSISASGNDVRGIDISYGVMPEGSDSYAEACGTYEDVIGEDDIEVNDEPILCFEFKGKEAYGFSLNTEEGVPCFFFCTDAVSDGKKMLLTVLLCAPDNEQMQSLLEFVEEYLSF